MSMVLAMSMGTSQSAAQDSRSAPEVLGGFPLCEGSAAVWLGRNHVLVGDNEERGSLFAFELNDERLEVSQSVARSLGDGVEISDIEAIVKMGSDQLLVFGSHGRNSRCRVRDNRRRFLRGTVTAEGVVATGSAVVAMRERISCERLFGEGAGNDPSLGALCERVDAVEQIADGVWDSARSEAEKEEACEEAQAFNAEGAVAVADGGGESVWVGLRSPLIRATAGEGGQDRDMAVLLRMRGLEEFAFDAAAVVDLYGRGVRELAVSNGTVFVIAGPVADGAGDHGLWAFPSGELQPGASIAPTFVAELPASAEGLAVIRSTGHVIIDGDQGDERCEQPAGYLAISLGP